MSAAREDVLRSREHAVTERERASEQLREANEQLVLAGVRADERSDQALASARAKDDFLAMLGHELRNPLSPILTTLELMEMREPGTFRTERAMIERHVHHMIRLVDDLLDVSRITGGKVRLDRSRVDLREIVVRAVEMVGALIDGKRHELVVDLLPNLIVDGDPARLAQVLANLIANAAKYTPDGGRIEVLGTRAADGVVITVRDNGIGITSEMLPRVFELFAQEQQSLARSNGGLGLGLAIVKTLVALHGGTVSAHSAGPGEGSEFVVALPIASIPDAVARLATPVRGVVIPRRILVVDDNHDTADLTAQILELIGHDVRVAYDGESAVARAFGPDVAFLDLGLPDIDGYDLARALRAAPLAPLRLIAVTGYGQPADRERTHDAGFDVHLVKPVDIATLRATIAS